MTPTPEDFITYISDRNFHRSFYLPANEARGRSQPLRITYADYGYKEDAGTDREAVVLICGPMLASRYLHIAKDAQAKKHKIRVINPDRFGFGDITDVIAEERVQLWLEVVPALLQHLNIKHVAVLAQSGGTIYALNVLLYLKQFLHPTHPYLALGAPWVLPSHSGTTAMQLLRVFPDAAVSSLDSFARWFHNNVVPATGFSENIVASVGSSIGSMFSAKATPDEQSIVAAESEAAFVFEEQLRPKMIDMAYEETVGGLGQEALMFLKRGNSHDWGPWEDYDRYVPMLADAYKTESAPRLQNLKVEVFFAETDIMIGNEAGPKWFDQCWREEMRGELIEYSSRFVKGTSHDGILDLRFGITDQIFAEVKRRSLS